jgi:sugar lactone lactonase YvrE
MNFPLPRLVAGASAYLVVLLAGLVAAADYSRPYTFSTLAGTASVGSQDGAGANARFYSPRAAAVDAAGNSYLVDTGNHVIRKITSAGVVSTLAGRAGMPGTADGTGDAARFDTPQDIAIDAAGNLFVTDTANHTIRKITPAGVVTTLAGAAKVSGNIDGSAAAARFNQPLGIAIDQAGNLFVTEEGNGAIRKITPAGAVSTYAGNFQFRDPYYCAIAVDAADGVYVVAYAFRDYRNAYDSEGRLLVYETVSEIGFLTKVAPDGTRSYLWQTSWTIDPPWARGLPYVITDIVAESGGKLILAGSRCVRRFSPTDLAINTVAGTGQTGSADGPAGSATFSEQFTLAAHPAGGFIVADAGNNIVRRVDANGSVATIAGLALERAEGTRDDTGGAARFAGASGVAVDGSGNVYVADTRQHCIRKITPTGLVTTLAGSPGVAGAADGTGTAARFNYPTGIALAPSGHLYVADTHNHAIRRVSPTGDVSTVAGSAGPNAGGASVFSYPEGVAVNSAGIIWIADTGHSAIATIGQDGVIRTPYGLPGTSGTVDGLGNAARFTQPTGIAAAPSGDVYVTEASLSPSVARVRKIAPDGNVSTVAGAENGYGDGLDGAGRFNRPRAIAADGFGNVFIVDTYNQLIRKISSAGLVTTLGGLVEAPGSSDGTGINARFFDPAGIAIDGNGTLYIGNGTNVRKGAFAPPPTISAQPVSQSVAAGGSASFSVTASSGLPASYLWTFNHTAIAGATNSTLSLSNVRAADAGDYRVTVTNDAGSVTSSAATLTVTAAPPPPSGGGSGGGGGGGAPSTWFLAALGALAGLRWHVRRRRARFA